MMIRWYNMNLRHIMPHQYGYIKLHPIHVINYNLTRSTVYHAIHINEYGWYRLFLILSATISHV